MRMEYQLLILMIQFRIYYSRSFHPKQCDNLTKTLTGLQGVIENEKTLVTIIKERTVNENLTPLRQV